jgi:hypothetical protein
MKDYEDSDDARMAHYLEIGAIELAGVDESGEMIFEIKEIAQEIAPELWEAHIEYVDKNLVELYEAGYIKVEYDDNLEAMISLSQEGFEIAKQRGLLPIDLDMDIPND